MGLYREVIFEPAIINPVLFYSNGFSLAADVLLGTRLLKLEGLYDFFSSKTKGSFELSNIFLLFRISNFYYNKEI